MAQWGNEHQLELSSLANIGLHLTAMVAVVWITALGIRDKVIKSVL